MIKSAEEFVLLRRSLQPDEYLRAATSPASVEVWHEVIQKYPDMKIWVAQNKTIPSEILNLLAHDEDSEVRAAVAMKNKLPEDLFLLLSRDPSEEVRQRILYNKNCPASILRSLVEDSSSQVSFGARTRLEVLLKKK